MPTTSRLVASLFSLAFVAGSLAEAGPPIDVRTRIVKAGDDMSIEVEQGTIEVPETRGDPSSRTIRLAFARLKGPMSGQRPPIVYLPGGSGRS